MYKYIYTPALAQPDTPKREESYCYYELPFPDILLDAIILLCIIMYISTYELFTPLSILPSTQSPPVEVARQKCLRMKWFGTTEILRSFVCSV